MSLAALNRGAVWIGRRADYERLRGGGDYVQDRDSIAVVLPDDATAADVHAAIERVAWIRHGPPRDRVEIKP